MRRVLIQPGWGVVAVAGVIAARALAAEIDPESSRRLAAYVEKPGFAQASWGVQAESLDTGEVLFSLNGHRLLQPASSVKCLVAGMVLDTFGGEHRFVTRLETDGTIDAQGTLTGGLVVRGGGDFSWSDTFGDGRGDEVLEDLVRQVAQAGIRQIRGSLIGDTRLFSGPPWGAGWAWDDLTYGYGAGVSALMFSDNRAEMVVRPASRVGARCEISVSPGPEEILDWVNRSVTAAAGSTESLRIIRVPGSARAILVGQMALDGRPWQETLSVPQPEQWFLEKLKRALVGRGVEVDGALKVLDDASTSGARDNAAVREIGRVTSPPLSELVRAMMRTSQNQYAQVLLLQAGAQRSTVMRLGAESPTLGSAEQGLRVLREFARRAGVQADELRMDEASGLSRSDRVSPAALVRLLKYMDTHRERDAFRNSLPVSHLSGPKGRIELQAKSGTMSDIFALAGYATVPNGRHLAFSVMLNGYEVEDREQGREAVLDLVRLLVDH